MIPDIGNNFFQICLLFMVFGIVAILVQESRNLFGNRTLAKTQEDSSSTNEGNHSKVSEDINGTATVKNSPAEEGTLQREYISVLEQDNPETEKNSKVITNPYPAILLEEEIQDSEKGNKIKLHNKLISLTEENFTGISTQERLEVIPEEHLCQKHTFLEEISPEQKQITHCHSQKEIISPALNETENDIDTQDSNVIETMSLTPLPRELKLIIDDICNENSHLLEWEVFGNATDDMRIVLTWRKIEKAKKNLNRRGSLGKWKLRQSSITIDEPGSDGGERTSPLDKNGEHWDSKQKHGDDIEELLRKEEAERKLKEEKERQRREDEEMEKQRRKQEERKRKEKEEMERKLREEEEERLNNERKKREEAERKLREEKERQRREDEEMEKQRKKQEERKRKEKEEMERKLREEEEEERLKQEARKRQLLEEEERRKKQEYEEEQRRKREEEELRRIQEEEEERQRKEHLRRIEEEKRRLREEEEDLLRKEEIARKLKEEETERKRREIEEQEYLKRKEEEEERKIRAEEIAKREVEKKEKTDNEDQKSSKKKKNPFRKLKKDEKVSRKGKLQLSLSIDESVYDENAKGEVAKEHDDSQASAPHIDDIGSDGKATDNNLSKEEEELVARVLEKEKVMNAEESGEEVGDRMPNSEKQNTQRIKSKEAAKKMLEMQRNKFKLSIDESAFDNIAMADMLPSNSQEVDSFSSLVISDIPELAPLDTSDSKRLHEERKEKASRERIPKLDFRFRVHPLDNIILGKTGWERCTDCKYNGFCDDLTHKAEYMTILLHDAENENIKDEDCTCNVCRGGAVHNGCVFRELLRLKTDYKLFDKRNLCFCGTCIPFKYRRMCLRQELKLFRNEGRNLYYRLTYHEEDGNEGYQPATYDDEVYYSDEEIVNENGRDKQIDAMCLDDIEFDITKEDKIDFRNCIDCQFNGFCDNLRHKKLYSILLCIDDEDFQELEDDCGCLVCEFKGAAHSGCVYRELKRLKYDLLLFDKRNLCYCHECVPFKYRTICLRQQLKNLRRKRGINLYSKLT